MIKVDEKAGGNKFCKALRVSESSSSADLVSVSWEHRKWSDLTNVVGDTRVTQPPPLSALVLFITPPWERENKFGSGQLEVLVSAPPHTHTPTRLQVSPSSESAGFREQEYIPPVNLPMLVPGLEDDVSSLIVITPSLGGTNISSSIKKTRGSCTDTDTDSATCDL